MNTDKIFMNERLLLLVNELREAKRLAMVLGDISKDEQAPYESRPVLTYDPSREELVLLQFNQDGSPSRSITIVDHRATDFFLNVLGIGSVLDCKEQEKIRISKDLEDIIYDTNKIFSIGSLIAEYGEYGYFDRHVCETFIANATALVRSVRQERIFLNTVIPDLLDFIGDDSCLLENNIYNHTISEIRKTKDNLSLLNSHNIWKIGFSLDEDGTSIRQINVFDDYSFASSDRAIVYTGVAKDLALIRLLSELGI